MARELGCTVGSILALPHAELLHWVALLNMEPPVADRLDAHMARLRQDVCAPWMKRGAPLRAYSINWEREFLKALEIDPESPQEEAESLQRQALAAFRAAGIKIVDKRKRKRG